MIKTQVVKLKVNKTMQKHLDALCDYRRYCWNKGLETWQLMYEAHSLNKQDNLSPNERRVRDELVANKADLSLIHISEPTRLMATSRMPSSA